ncbi:MAG: hypothetical protein M3444_01980 [Acidobacteriota bacterium]|nr:hypothetical protein [Acidobacteriota bacterium]MDQ5835251.1 hypothetical protein [Acidobacteriota bacterium]
MNANKLLGISLDALAAKLRELAEEYPSELKPVCDLLGSIASHEENTDVFRRDLKDLAEVVIQVRTQKGSPLRFRELPVPPYDLWLPFKAEDLTPSDPEDIVDAVRIFNHKVSELAFTYCRDNCDARDARPGQETPGQGAGSEVKPKTQDS